MKIDFLQNFIEVDKINSTNDFLKSNYKNLQNWTTIKTGFQTKGHGQFGRIWTSQKNKNLLVSVLFKKLPFNAEDFSFVVNTIINTLKYFGVQDAKFKYPNDVYVDEFKIAGILIEKKYENKQLEYMIIGMGININQQSFKNLKATSIKNITNKDTDLKEFNTKLFSNLSNSIEELQKTQF